MPYLISLSAAVCISTLVLLHQYLTGALNADETENAT